MKENKRVSKTAWLTAYLRSFSDIPYSKEIFNEFDKLEDYHDASNRLKFSKGAPQLEARHKLINKMLTQSRITQILEIASGASSRGLSMAEDKAIKYVEVDLPDIIAQKRVIINKIKKTRLPNLHLESGNALNLNDLKSATKYFNRSKPIAIVNEGLMRYFNFNEKAKYAKNVHSILTNFDGLWITSDITTVQQLERENSFSKGQNNNINKLTKVNQFKNSFDSLTKAEEFFNHLGFSIKVHKYSEVKKQLSSPKRLRIPDKEVDWILEPWVVFVMKPLSTVST